MLKKQLFLLAVVAGLVTIAVGVWLNRADAQTVCPPTATPQPSPTVAPTPSPTPKPTVTPSPVPTPTAVPTVTPKPYPWHTNIIGYVFWIGEPVGGGSTESQTVSAYDDAWQEHYGGPEGGSSARAAEFPPRRTGPLYLPRRYDPVTRTFGAEFVPNENPFFADVPYDDINTRRGRDNRRIDIPWANQPPYNTMTRNQSMLKNRWVEVKMTGGTVSCYAQIEDAGPYIYYDPDYVFGNPPTRPLNSPDGKGGIDVSPSVRDCLGFRDLNSDTARVDWRFVEANEVPPGPWKNVVTTRQVYQP